MKTIKINLNKINQKTVELIIDYLKRGKVIAYPTDTIYGLGCDAGNEEAIRKIQKIKNKENKAMLALISDIKMLKKYCFINKEQEDYLKKVWTGRPHPNPLLSKERGQRPVTVILKKRANLPAILTAGQDSLAVRLPASDFLIKIINRLGRPLVSTSLNKTGEKPLGGVTDLEKYFNDLPDLVVDAGKCQRTKASRLVDLRDVNDIKILRK
jgi:L-threonylcarbamoyladenylate synthase